MHKKLIVLVRGAGDLATGIIWYMYKSGFDVVCTEIDRPTTIRRKVSFSEAVYDNRVIVESVIYELAKSYVEIDNLLIKHIIPIVIDEKLEFLSYVNPDILVDCIMAKKNLGTNIKMADLVIGVGPGFEANVDCNYVVETMRGHNLGRIYSIGKAIKNTGVPGNIVGYTIDRVKYSDCDGIIYNYKKIGDIVKKGDCLSVIKNKSGDSTYVLASISGVIRGIIKDGFLVYKGLKIADIDPRIDEKNNCNTISDKSRTIAGSVLLIINKYMSNIL